MNQYFSLLKQYYNQLKGFFPSYLPVGKTEFEVWSQSIIDTYKPACDDVSVKFSLSAMIQHLNPNQWKKSKRYFAQCLHKGCAGQVASQIMWDIKQEQKRQEAEAKKAAEEAAKQLTEATVNTPTVASNVHPISS